MSGKENLSAVETTVRKYICVIGGSTVDIFGCAKNSFIYR